MKCVNYKVVMKDKRMYTIGIPLVTKTDYKRMPKPKNQPKKKIKNTTPSLRGKKCPMGHTVCSCS